MKRIIIAMLILFPVLSFAQVYKVKVSIVNNKQLKCRVADVVYNGLSDDLVNNIEDSLANTLTFDVEGAPGIRGFGLTYTDGTTEKYYFLYVSGPLEIQILPSTSIDNIRVIGSQISQDYEHLIWSKMSAINDRTDVILKKIKVAKTKNESITALQSQVNENVRLWHDVPRQYIKANPSNPLAFWALMMLRDGDPTLIGAAKAADLEGLIALLPQDVQSKPEVLEMKDIAAGWR